MREGPASEINDAALEAAACWHARLAAEDDGGTTVRQEFERWLSSDAVNRAAFEKICLSLAQVDVFAAEREIIAIRRDALDRAHRSADFERITRRRRWASVAAAVCFMALAGVLFVVFRASPLQQFTTADGERRVITLRDGSQLSMDASTRITVAYSKAARHLEILQGQTRFAVARDVSRPFTVTARDRTVVATGTMFNVDLLNHALLVTLIEGRVRVESAAGAEPLEMLADQQLRIDAEGAVVRSRVNTTEISAWERGKLVFENEPLPRAIERVNRYSQRKISFDEGKMNRLHVSGVFNIGDMKAFVEGVTASLPVRADELPDGYVFVSAP